MMPIVLAILLAALVVRGVDAFFAHLTAQGRWFVLLVVVLLLALLLYGVPESRTYLWAR